MSEPVNRAEAEEHSTEVSRSDVSGPARYDPDMMDFEMTGAPVIIGERGVPASDARSAAEEKDDFTDSAVDLREAIDVHASPSASRSGGRLSVAEVSQRDSSTSENVHDGGVEQHEYRDVEMLDIEAIEDAERESVVQADYSANLKSVNERVHKWMEGIEPPAGGGVPGKVPTVESPKTPKIERPPVAEQGHVKKLNKLNKRLTPGRENGTEDLMPGLTYTRPTSSKVRDRVAAIEAQSSPKVERPALPSTGRVKSLREKFSTQGEDIGKVGSTIKPLRQVSEGIQQKIKVIEQQLNKGIDSRAALKGADRRERDGGRTA